MNKWGPKSGFWQSIYVVKKNKDKEVGSQNQDENEK